MKVYSIGREVNCDIVINDQTDIISRRHAILNVSPFGKMTITDQSHNGTYVNGIRISSNVPVPVTRKDNISFAHIARLDWNLIPDTRKKILWFVLGCIAALALLAGLVWGISKFVKHGEPASAPTPTETPAVVDTIPAKQTEEQLRKEEERKQDSIKKHIRDSIDKERTKKVTPTSTPRKKDEGRKNDNSGNSNPPKKQEPKKEDSGSTTRFH